MLRQQAMQDMPELNELSKQIIVDQTPEGLRIQLVDQEGRSMFQEGSAALQRPRQRSLLCQSVAKVINKLAQPRSPSPAIPAPAPQRVPSPQATGRCPRTRAPTPSRRLLQGASARRSRPDLSGSPARPTP